MRKQQDELLELKRKLADTREELLEAQAGIRQRDAMLQELTDEMNVIYKILLKEIGDVGK